MAGAVLAAKVGQRTPDSFYKVERMLKRVAADRGRVLLCRTCMDARGRADAEPVAGAQRSTMDALATETDAARKVPVL